MIKLIDFMSKLQFDGEKVHVYSIDDETFVFIGTKEDYFNSVHKKDYQVCTFYVNRDIITVNVKVN